MDPATIAAVAAVGGAVVDWFSGERAARKARKHTKQVATDEAYGSVMGRVEAAKAAGLHPLATLGVPTSSGMNSGGALTDFRSVGSEIGNAYSQQRQWRAEREFNEMQMKTQKNEAAQRQLMDQARLNADLAMNAKQMSFIDEQIRASREESIRRNLSATKPTALSVSPTKAAKAIPEMYVPVRDRNGVTRFIPNPDIYDLELPDVIGAGTLVLPEAQNSRWLDTVKQKWQDYQRQRREVDAMNPRLNPYRLPVPIGD